MSNIIHEKSYSFALKIVDLYKNITKNQKEFTLSKQLLRCGTSIGANVEESQGGQTRKDFATKIQIAYKESLEAIFWLRLLRDSKYIEKRTADGLINECIELRNILGSIHKTVRKKIDTK